MVKFKEKKNTKKMKNDISLIKGTFKKMKFTDFF